MPRPLSKHCSEQVYFRLICEVDTIRRLLTAAPALPEWEHEQVLVLLMTNLKVPLDIHQALATALLNNEPQRIALRLLGTCDELLLTVDNFFGKPGSSYRAKLTGNTERWLGIRFHNEQRQVLCDGHEPCTSLQGPPASGESMLLVAVALLLLQAPKTKNYKLVITEPSAHDVNTSFELLHGKASNGAVQDRVAKVIDGRVAWHQPLPTSFFKTATE